MPSNNPLPAVLRSASDLFRRLTVIRPKEAKLTVGLDIGSHSVKVVALGPRKIGSTRPLLGQNIVPIPAGSDADPSDTIKSAVSVLQIPTRQVNISVSGQWVIMRIVEMPTMKPHEMKQALPFEAQRYLPFNLQDVIIDGASLGPAEGNKTWVLIVACKKELIERRMDWVKRAGFEPSLIDVDALALANSYLGTANGSASEQTSALINIGAQLSNLVIFKGETPYLVRDVPWGGDKLLRGVAEQAGLEPEELNKQLAGGQPSHDLSATMKTVTEALMTELQLSFDYFENRFGQPPERLLVSGGVVQMPGFVESLKGQIAQPVESWTPVNGLSAQFAVAYGLALRSA